MIKRMVFTLVVLSGLTLAITLPRGADQPLAPQLIIAQAAKTCPDIVSAALKTVDQRCSSTGRNSVCYGNVQVQVTPQAGAPKFNFAKPGDKTQLSNIDALQLTSLDADANDWGIALMRIQANLPNTAAGQNVTMLLFGNVKIDDNAKDAVYPTVEPTDFVKAPPAVPNVTLTPGGKPTATPSKTPRPTSTRRPSATPRITPTATTPAYKSMQAFYFSSGVGEPACAQAPEDGILVQSPKGATQKIELQVDEARIVIGSTVFLQAQAGKEMIISTLEGSAEVSAFGQTSVAAAGARVRVPIDANLKASGPPSPPEPYDLNVMKALPAQHLPVKVTPAKPIATLPAGFTASMWRITWSGWSTSGARCVGNPRSNGVVTLGSNGSSLYWDGNTFSASGGSFSFSKDVQGSFALTHQVTKFSLTSPTHGEGLFTSVYITPPVCTFSIAFHMEKVGGADLATAAP